MMRRASVKSVFDTSDLAKGVPQCERMPLASFPTTRGHSVASRPDLYGMKSSGCFGDKCSNICLNALLQGQITLMDDPVFKAIQPEVRRFMNTHKDSHHNRNGMSFTQ